MSLALKLSSLLVRTLAKPIANAIKANAKDHPAFRKVCIGFAQRVHRMDFHIRMRLLNTNKKDVDKIKIRPLNDTKAIQNGANFLAESFVFSVAGGLIVYESWRSRRKEQARQESVVDDIKVLQHEINWIRSKLDNVPDDFDPPKDVKPLILQILRDEGIDSSVNSPETNVSMPTARAPVPSKVSTNALPSNDGRSATGNSENKSKTAHTKVTFKSEEAPPSPNNS